MRTLRRLGGGCDDISCRRRRTGARRDRAPRASRAALIDNSVNPSTRAVGNVERAIGSDCEARRTMFGALGSSYSARKTVREDFAVAGRMIACQRLKDDVVAALRVGRPVPRTVEGDEYAITIAGWKLVLVVMHKRIRRPMGRKRRYRRELVRARANRLAAITTIFRRKHQFFLKRVVITLGPAIVSARLQEHDLFSRQRGFLIRFVKIRPIRVQLISPVLRYE